MNGEYLNYQFSVFGDFSDITPNNSQVLIDILSLYKDKNFIPSIFQEVPVGIIQSKSSNRIMLSNADGWNMNIGNIRIDLILSKNGNTKYENMDFELVLKDAKELLNKLLNMYQKKANRIALNTSFLFNVEDSKKFDKNYVKRGNLVKFYDEKNNVEWEERKITQIKDEKFDNQEVVNIGTALSKTSGEIIIGNKTTPFSNRIIMQLDINTAPNNATHRFDNEKINLFFDIANKYKSELEASVQEIINND